jgi:hypothetical protein
MLEAHFKSEFQTRSEVALGNGHGGHVFGVVPIPTRKPWSAPCPKHNMNRHRGLGRIIWGVSKINYSMCLWYFFWDLSLNSKELPRTRKWTQSPLQVKLASLTKSGARAKQNSFKINDPRRGSNCLICGAPVLRFWGCYGGLDDQVRPLFQSLRHFDSIKPLRPFIIRL